MNASAGSAGPIHRAGLAHRIVQAGMLIALVWKWSFFVVSARLYADITLDDPFFPDWLRSALCIVIAYLLTISTITVNILTSRRLLQRLCSMLTFLGATILCVHQGSYNDMTFVTAWWTSLWALWYVHHLDDPDQDAMLCRAALLSRLILSMILLGGAAGKWTSEYWSGEVFYDIYFLDRDYWIFNWLRANFDTDTLREISCWYSRKVVVIETVAGLGLWMLPPRWGAAAGVILLALIALLSNLLLFSVLTSLIGLATVGFFVKPASRL